jgi:hypothetical protein
MNVGNKQDYNYRTMAPAVNVWALNKDPNIKSLLLRLQSHLGSDEFIIEENDDLHPSSVFLHHTNHADYRAFVYTFSQLPNRFGVHLEYPDLATSGNLFEAQENITFKSLVDMLAVHFDIAEIHHLSLL